MRAGQPRALAIAALALLALGGCGDAASDSTASGPTAAETSTSASAPSTTPAQQSASPSASPAATGLPACADIWRVGVRMPVRYRGCAKGGEVVRAAARPCESGRSLITYGEHLFAMEGGTVSGAKGKALLSQPAYKDLLARCTA